MSELTQAEVSALREALDDEYSAWATYEQVIADFGEVRPFSNIREAEARHIEALLTLFRRYELAIPDNPWPGKVNRYDSVREACEAGVAAEIANVELYDRLLAATEREAIRTVLRNLQEASQQRHLAAFRRCAEGGPGKGHGSVRKQGGRE
ncbi:ferritin-like domain-containing protein [Thiohalorhabdus sp.]|uniref:ferritin-like domain-containing protein n=1 Tax=Thiohalorhabdus sp. TaxID=3094134 RepID=UPI002FC2A5ED